MTKQISALADKFELYTRAFQNPAASVDFVRAVFQQENGEQPVFLREDFCWTAAVCCEWIRSATHNRAIGVDIDSEPLDWCREHLLTTLTPMQVEQVQLIHDDVLNVTTSQVDVILALNCSFCVFKRRDNLKQYAEVCHRSLADNGIFVLELYAGPEAQRCGEDRFRCDDFVVIWEQAEFNAVTNEALNRVHFELPDGTHLRNAFFYDFRMWSPAELTEVLLECGFRDARVYRKSSQTNEQGIAVCRRADVPDYWEVYVIGFK